MAKGKPRQRKASSTAPPVETPTITNAVESISAAEEMLSALPTDQYGAKESLSGLVRAVSGRLTGSHLTGPLAKLWYTKRRAGLGPDTAGYGKFLADLNTQLAKPGLGPDDLIYVRNKAVADFAKLEAGAGYATPRQALAVLRDYGGKIDKAVASELLSVEPARFDAVMKELPLKTVLEGVAESPSVGSVGEKLLPHAATYAPKLRMRAEVHDIVSGLAQVGGDEEALKSGLSQAADRLGKLGVSRERVGKLLSAYGKIPPPAKAPGAIKAFFTNPGGGVSGKGWATGLAAVAAAAAGLMWLARDSTEEKMAKKAKAAEQSRSTARTLNEDVAQALLGKAGAMSPDAGQNLLTLMAMAQKQQAEAGSLGGAVEALGDQAVLAPMQRARWGRTEIPLAAAMAARQYEQDMGWTLPQAQGLTQGPGPVPGPQEMGQQDIRAALAARGG